MLDVSGAEDADPFQSPRMISGASLQDGQQTERREGLHSELAVERDIYLQDGSRIVVPTGADREPRVLFVQAQFQAAIPDLARDLVPSAHRPLRLAKQTQGDL